MPQWEDLVIYDRDGRPIAMVVVKAKLDTSAQWAAQFRRNILAHGDTRPADFFLLVTPEWIYLWKDPGIEPVELPPTFTIDARPLLKPYFDSAKVSASGIDGLAFQLVVGSWFADLSRLGTRTERPMTVPEGLTESKLLQAINNGRVEYAAVA